MAEKIRFHFDPLCPWAWQSSRWIRAVEVVRDVEVDWRLFSLALINADKDDPLADVHATGTSALRSLALVMREEGNGAVGRVYEALGNLTHERDTRVSDEILLQALRDGGSDPGVLERALADDSTSDAVRRQHDAAVEEVGCFGVPTIVVSSGKGIFGPVVSVAPEGEAAGELWDHVRWLTEADGFFELKRNRDRAPGQAA
jgi:predicted DsbA family dithiol-disulfide isomerase